MSKLLIALLALDIELVCLKFLFLPENQIN